ncbi:MAG TPA: hypothetical protein VH025_08625 [Solirubrobacteraceae bacterium]|jgi:hypothetical protein|nr:hypothetical protein [Solirubrobacteraceae bacterium]
MRFRVAIISAAVLAATLASTAASSSAAEPAFYECAKVAAGTGKFADKKCSKPGAGKTAKYELKEGIGKGKPFKGKGGKATLKTPTAGGEVICGSNTDTGRLVNSTHAGGVVVTFAGCTSIGKKCATSGAKAGTIVTKPLQGELGYVQKSTKKVGVALKAETGSVEAEFSCEGLAIVVTGGVIGEISPVNTFTKTANLAFTVTGSGFQSVTKLEGGATTVLEAEINGAGPFESGLEATGTLKTEELEIKA